MRVEWERDSGRVSGQVPDVPTFGGEGERDLGLSLGRVLKRTYVWARGKGSFRLSPVESPVEYGFARVRGSSSAQATT